MISYARLRRARAPGKSDRGKLTEMKRGREAGSARWRGRRVESVAHTAKIALEANWGALWVAGSGLPVSSSRASIGPLCHCQYSKEIQIIWWLMVHSCSHCIYNGRVVRPRSRTDTALPLFFSPFSGSFTLFLLPFVYAIHSFLFLPPRAPLNDPQGLFSLNFLLRISSRFL